MRQHGSSYIPYGVYECRLPQMFPTVPMHWHDEFEIDSIEDGSGEMICGAERFKVSRGDVILIPPNELHATYLSEKEALHYQAFVFHPSLLGIDSNDRTSTNCLRPLCNGNLKLKTCYDRNFSAWDEINTLVRQLLQSVTNDSALEDLMVKSCLYHLFFLFEKYGTEHHKQSPDKTLNPIRPALAHMSEHYAQELTIKDLARICGISESHFMNTFQKTVGLSAMNYLEHLRIRSVCEELLVSTDSIATIAFRNGYNNLSNFNRQFKKITGYSPREYQKKCSAQTTVPTNPFL